MSEYITNQLVNLAATLNQQDGRSTLIGAVNEIEFLKSDRDRWIRIASALYNDLLEGSEYNFESSTIYEEAIKNY